GRRLPDRDRGGDLRPRRGRALRAAVAGRLAGRRGRRRGGGGRDRGGLPAAVHERPEGHRRHRPGRPRPGPGPEGAARMSTPAAEVAVRAVPGLPEVRPGDDLAALIAGAAELRDGDVLGVTSKIVSKAEGRIRRMDREAAIDAETERVVARRGRTRIVQTRTGLVMAAAGVDTSNVEAGSVLLLPEDPDASARRIRAGLRDRLGVRVAVLVSDTFGRPWRNGQTDVAIGAAGLDPVQDLRGSTDTHGNVLEVTLNAVADEIAAAGELVKGKAGGTPVALVRGLSALVTEEDGPGAAALVRPADEDLFRYGSRDGVPARRTVREVTPDPVAAAAVRRAVRAAGPAPAPQPTAPRRRAPPRPLPGGTLPGRGGCARLSGRAARFGRAVDVPGRDGRRGAEPAGGPGHGGAGLGLGVVHHVLPGHRTQGAGPAAGLAADGVGRGRPSGGAPAGPPAARPGRVHRGPLTRRGTAAAPPYDT